MSTLQKTHQNHKSESVSKSKNSQAGKPAAPRMNAAQSLTALEAAQPGDVLAAQQQVGNQVVQRALDKGKNQDQAADKQGNLRGDLASQIQQNRGSGSPLPGNLQQEASKKLGRSFKDVRLHTDGKADELSRSISARAFTIGSDIFFKGGVYEPGSSQGHETLLHELTHVVQQSGGKGRSGQLKLGAPDTAMEKQAEKVSKQNSHAKMSASPAAAGPSVQRQPESGAVVQRELDLLTKKKPPKVDTSKPNPHGVTPDALQNQIGKLRKTDTSERDAIEKGRAKDTHSEYKKEAKTHNISNSREALMAKLKDPSTSTEDAKLAQQKLDSLHKRGKMETLKAKLTPGKDGRSYSEQAGEARKKSLKQAALGGDDNAFKSMMAEKAERKKNSTSTKIKGALGGLLGKLGGAIGGAVKDQGVKLGTEYKDHFLGKKKEEEGDEKEGKEKKGAKGHGEGGHETGGHEEGGHSEGGHAKGNGGGHEESNGGGGGGGDVYKQLFDMTEKYNKLKAQMVSGGSTGGGHGTTDHGSSDSGTSGHGPTTPTTPEHGGTTTTPEHGGTTTTSGHGGTTTTSGHGGTTTTSGHGGTTTTSGHGGTTSPSLPTPEHGGTTTTSETGEESEAVKARLSHGAPLAPKPRVAPKKLSPEEAHKKMMESANKKFTVDAPINSDPGLAHQAMVKKANAKDAPESGIYSNPEQAHSLMQKKANVNDAPELTDPLQAHKTMVKKANTPVMNPQIKKTLQEAMLKRRAQMGYQDEPEEPEKQLDEQGDPVRDESEWD